MYVFVSWAYTSEAEKAEERRVAWVEELRGEDQAEIADSLTTAVCLPEYDLYLKAIAESDTAPTFDKFNQDLLSVRFVIPTLERIATYQLSKRLPGSGKLPASVAARAMLLNSFEGLWSGEKHNKTLASSVKFVGLANTRDFFKRFALACGALNQPLPYDLWGESEVIDIASGDNLRELLESCALNVNEEEAKKYQSLLFGWLGVGTSAEKESGLNVAASLKLGIK